MVVSLLSLLYAVATMAAETSNTPEYSNDSELYGRVSDALTAEIVAAAVDAAGRPSFDDIRTAPHILMKELAATDPRFAEWPAAAIRGRCVAAAVRHQYQSTYWRLNAGGPHMRLDATLDPIEATATQQLIELVLWSRVDVEPTGNTVYGLCPTREAISSEYAALRYDLLGFGSLYPEDPIALPGITWQSVVTGLMGGRVQFGPFGVFDDGDPEFFL